MSLFVKICGINAPDALMAAVDGGADMVGFVFYPPSPRHLTPPEAALLADMVPSGIDRVGVFVDPTDDRLEQILSQVRLDLLQLHGEEDLARIGQIRSRFGLPIIKAVKVATAADIDVDAIARAVDWLLFDARPPSGQSTLPGGNAAAFDWRLMAGRCFSRPWLLSGGLTTENLASAVAISAAKAVDVSSGVEERPGRKTPARIRAFLDTAKAL
jgi:phosphoribosylanthranilate isomerase